jgi:tight adherence protein B
VATLDRSRGGSAVIRAELLAAGSAALAVASFMKPVPRRPWSPRGRWCAWLERSEALLLGYRVRQTSHANDVATFASTLAAELRAGRQPEEAWGVTVAATARLPGTALPQADVVQLLRRWSGRPGWTGLRALAICGSMADESGGGLAEALDRVAAAMRHEHDIVLEVGGQLSSTRATAALLAVLPLVTLGIATLLGAHPLGALLGSPVGLACLAVGAALSAAGSWWVARQVAAVHRLLRW